jgi:hypothetical protein
VKDSFYEHLECAFDKLPTDHTKLLLGDLNDKVERKGIFNLTIKKKVYTKLVMKMDKTLQ